MYFTYNNKSTCRRSNETVVLFRKIDTENAELFRLVNSLQFENWLPIVDVPYLIYMYIIYNGKIWRVLRKGRDMRF